jgi:hypothetical protein
VNEGPRSSSSAINRFIAPAAGFSEKSRRRRPKCASLSVTPESMRLSISS